MFESNPLIVVKTQFDWDFESKGDLESYASMVSHYESNVTITSIEVRLPQFSIGDTVMIVDTGEIGEIKFESLWEFLIYNWETHTWVSPQQIVKIPQDLLHKLQD